MAGLLAGRQQVVSKQFLTKDLSNKKYRLIAKAGSKTNELNIQQLSDLFLDDKTYLNQYALILSCVKGRLNSHSTVNLSKESSPASMKGKLHALDLAT